MAWCLLPKYVEELKKLDVEKLSKLSPSARHDFLKERIGEEAATNVNAHFESKLLLKNQQLAMKNVFNKYFKNVSVDTKRDIISKIEKMDRRILDPKEKDVFLEDLASKKLGTKVSFEDVKTITKYSKELGELKEKIPESSPNGSKERIEYGLKLVSMQDFIKDIKLKNEKLSLRDYISRPQEILYSLGGLSKSILSSLDNSFHGRQNNKTLYLNPAQWFKQYIKSWKDVGVELSGNDARKLVKAEVYSRQNALNGYYKAAKLDIGTGEEAFPTSLPAKVPGFGRLFKASESAYGASAIRTRADTFDKYISEAQKNGVDTNNKDFLRDYGRLVNSQTGRGDIGSWESQAKHINQAIFSIKFLKSNVDTLVAPFKMWRGVNRKNPAKVKAAKNTFRIIASIAGVLALSDTLNPGSVEWDSRSSNFGKIRISEDKDLWMDITGGMASLVTLASRLITRSTKNRKGKVVDLTADKYGARTALDFAFDFVTGKLSPIGSLVASYFRGKLYGDKPLTGGNIAKQALVPIGVQTAIDLEDPSSADSLLQLLAEFHGFNVSQPYKKKIGRK